MSYNSKQLKVQSSAKKLPKPKDVIYDPMGQWKFPGQITKIPSGNITMQGVPYPVLGKDNLGNEIMMQTDKNYQFPGTSVTEYPQFQKGGDYNMLGYAMHHPIGALKHFINPEKYHATDEYKKPNHITFSDESKYSNQEHKGGHWEKQNNGTWTFTPSSWNIKNAEGYDKLQDWWSQNEGKSGNILLPPSDDPQIKLGGWLNSYKEEYKKGGQKGLKKFTSKNIQTSLNDIMQRNTTLFRSSGKKRYKPDLNYKYGGWLEQYQGDQNGSETGTGSTYSWSPSGPYGPVKDVTSATPTYAGIDVSERAIEQSKLRKEEKDRQARKDKITYDQSVGEHGKILGTLSYAAKKGDDWANSTEPGGGYETAGKALEFAAMSAMPLFEGVGLLKKPITTAAKWAFNNAVKSASKLKLPTYQNSYQWQADQIPSWLSEAGETLTPEQKLFTGKWHTTDIRDVPFYMRTRPGSGNVNIVRMSTKNLENLENNMPGAAKGMSGKKTPIVTSTTNQPGELIIPNGANITSNKSFRFDVNPFEYVPQLGKIEPTSPWGKYHASTQVSEFLKDMVGSQYPSILGMPRKYFPFKQGGEKWLDQYQDGSQTKANPLLIQAFQQSLANQKINEQKAIDAKNQEIKNNPLGIKTLTTARDNTNVVPIRQLTTLSNIEADKKRNEADRLLKQQKKTQGTLRETPKEINPNEAWRLAASNYQGHDKEEMNRIINSSKTVEGLGALAGVTGGGLHALASIPAVANTIGLGFAAHGVHSLPSTYRTLVDPNESVYNKARALTYNTADFLGMKQAAEALKGVGTAGKWAYNNAARSVATSKESGLLSNTRKLNPWAFKPNETNWYRQVGKSAIDDAFNTGIVREAGEEVSPRMFQEFQDQLVRMQGSGMDAALASRRPASPFFGKGELFYPMGRKPTINKVTGKLSKNPAGKGSADYLIETALPNESFQPAYVKGMGLGVPTETGATAILKPDPSLRNLENFNIYKKDWLRGYKEVPKQLPGSPNVDPPIQQMGFFNTKGAFQKYPKGKLTQEEINAFKNSDHYKQSTKEHLELKNKFGNSWTLPNYAEEALQEAITTGNRSRINPILYGGRNWGVNDYIIAGLAGTAYPGVAGLYGLAFSPPAVKNKVLNTAGITSTPGTLSSKDTTINITNRPMDFAKVNETADGQVIIGGEFIEGTNNTVRKAKDWLTATDTYSDKEYPSKDIQSFYGIEDGKFKVGKASEFKPNTEIVPRRFGATNISQAILNEGAMRLLDNDGNPIYQNTPNTGKFILYSPSTKEVEFNYINTGKSGVDKVNKFLKKNKDAQYIHLDNGRYEFYGLNPEGLSGQDFRDYYQQDLEREGNPGYNMIIKKHGGWLDEYQDGGGPIKYETILGDDGKPMLNIQPEVEIIDNKYKSPLLIGTKGSFINSNGSDNVWDKVKQQWVAPPKYPGLQPQLTESKSKIPTRVEEIPSKRIIAPLTEIHKPIAESTGVPVNNAATINKKLDAAEMSKLAPFIAAEKRNQEATAVARYRNEQARANGTATGLYDEANEVRKYLYQQDKKKADEDRTAVMMAGLALAPAALYIAGVPAVSTALAAGFGAHGVYSIPNTYRNWVAAADPNNETTWEDSLGTTALNALDFWGTGQVLKQGSRLYNTVATGQSALPIAWKSQAVGLSQEASQKMFNSLVNSGKLTDAERALIVEYQHHSRAFTGRGVPVNLEKQQALNNIINKYNLSVGENTLLTRRFNPDNNSLGATLENGRLNFGNRPTSFSAGIGIDGYNSGAVNRLVIPSKYVQKMSGNFLANEYGNLSDDALNLMSNETKEFSKWIGDKKSIINAEKEVIGTGLDFKRIGKVKNDIGGHDWIVRPSKQVPKQLPGSPNAVASVDDIVTQLRNELSEKGIVSSQKTLNLPWKEPIRKGIEPWGYTNDNASLLPITGSKFKDVKGAIIGGKNPSYLSDKEYLMKSGSYDFKLRKANDLLIKEGKDPIYDEFTQELLKNKPVLSNEKNIKDAINLRDKIKYTYVDKYANESFIKNQRNRYATWDMYLGKPQIKHPMYDISELTKSKDDVIYTIKEDFINMKEAQYVFDHMLPVLKNPKSKSTIKWKQKDNSFIVPEKDSNIFGTMGGFHWKITKLPDGNYKAIANDVWDIQPFKNRTIGNSDKLSGRILNAAIKPIQNIEVGKTLGIGKPLNVKVGFIINGETAEIINTFGLGGAIKKVLKKDVNHNRSSKFVNSQNSNWLNKYQ
jgi:hypothetical protein